MKITPHCVDCDAISNLVYITPDNTDLRMTTVSQSEATTRTDLLKEHSPTASRKLARPCTCQIIDEKKKRGRTMLRQSRRTRISRHTSVLSRLPVTSSGIAFNATSQVTNCDKDSAEFALVGSREDGERWESHTRKSGFCV